MVLYILKSTACMAILLLFYKFLLEKETMHVFKRYYLLGALVVSLLIPSIVFTEYIEASPVIYSSTEEVLTIADTILPIAETPKEIDVINIPLVLLSIYLLGLTVFGFRFSRNLFQIITRIRKNPKYKNRFTTHVLLLEKIVPHTFFQFIFLNKSKVEANAIPKEVLLHEETHAKQKHSLDVLFVEILQVVFWFNPLVFLYKQQIKLNHEFLADSAVLKENVPTIKYQNTLLSYLSSASEEKYQSIKMANAINYSSIKKRFKIMKTQTSKKAILLRSVLVLPLFAFLLFAFSTKKEVVQTSNHTTPLSVDKTARSIEIIILKDGQYLVEGIKTDKNNLVDIVNTLHEDITPEIRRNIMNIHLDSSEEITREEVWFVYDSLLDYGFYRLVTDEQIVNLSKGNKPLAIENGRTFINPVQQKSFQQSASRKLMAEYNALAKKYNEMDSKRMRIQKSDVERLEYIYGLMSDKQKADAEPFPNFPEPPPAPDAPNAREEVSERIQQIIEEQDPYDVVGGNLINSPPNSPKAPKTPLTGTAKQLQEKNRSLQKEARQLQAESDQLQKEAKQLQGEARKLTNIPPPPLPPEPPTPLDHIIEMAKKGATFYYEGKEVSSDKAIELIKNNENLNIQTTRSNSKKPQVQISKNPIKIGRVSKKSELLDYALELEKKNADFYYDNEPIDSKKGIALIKAKKYASVETLPWVEKNPEVKIYSE